MKSYYDILNESSDMPKKPFRETSTMENKLKEKFELVIDKDGVLWFKHDDMYNGEYMELNTNYVYGAIAHQQTPFSMNKEETKFYLDFIHKNKNNMKR